jgi:transcriptional regulator GlxA family with amidase domain
MQPSHRVFMLAFPECQLLDVAGPMQMFAGANTELGRQAYALTILAPTEGAFKTSSGMRLVADLAFADLAPMSLGVADTIVVAGGEGGPRAIAALDEITAFVRAAGQTKARIVSICSGAFFLAAAGLLDGRRAATHWRAVEKLRRFYPLIEVDAEAIFVRDGNVWTSAGVTAGIDLALAIIDADFGPETSLAVARRHVVFRSRPGGQGQFALESVVPEVVKDNRLSGLLERIAGDLKVDWRADTLATNAGVSLRTLNRLFRDELNTSPAEFVDHLRVDRARRALLDTNGPIEGIARDCGFGSLRRMDRAFARTISTTPSDYRARFNPPEMAFDPASRPPRESSATDITQVLAPPRAAHREPASRRGRVQ